MVGALVHVAISSSHKVRVYNAFGSTHVVVDVVGCYSTSVSADSQNDGRSVFSGDLYLGSFNIAPNDTHLIDLVDRARGVGPQTGVEAVHLLLFVSGPSQSGYLKTGDTAEPNPPRTRA